MEAFLYYRRIVAELATPIENYHSLLDLKEDHQPTDGSLSPDLVPFVAMRFLNVTQQFLIREAGVP